MKKGDFVSITARGVNEEESYGVQGVYMGDNLDGTYQIQGMDGVYRGIEEGHVVPEKNIFYGREWLDGVRRTI